NLPGENWKTEALGNGRFWLDRIKKVPCDVYLFNTPVLPFWFKPKRSIVIALDYPYNYLKATSIKDSLRRILVRWYHHRSLKRAEHIIAVSHSTKNDTMRFYNIPSDKISVVYHGYKDVCKLPEKKVVTPSRFFFFAGTIKERKNILNIIKAFLIFSDSEAGVGFSLVLGGKKEGAYCEEMQRFVQEHNLNEKVLFLGHLKEDELSYVYKRSEGLVFPSIVEGTGFPILEAMAGGVPVITSNIFGPAELGAHGSAFLVDPYNAAEIAASMTTIVTNPEARARHISAGFEQVKKFNWTNTGKETRELLERTARSLRITYLTHNVRLDNGGGVLSRHIVDGFRSRGATVHLFTSLFSKLPGEEKLVMTPFSFFQTLFRLRRAARASDVIHAFDAYPYGFLAWLVNNGLGKKIVLTLVGTGTLHFLRRRFIGFFARAALKGAYARVAISTFIKKEVEKIAPRISLGVITPGVERNMPVADDHRARMYKPYILSVGAIRWRKGYKRSIEAFAEVTREFPELNYVIVGKKYKDGYYDELQKIIEKHDLSKRVHVISDAEEAELQGFYKNAELFCLLSQNFGSDVEGFGIVFLEAALHGLALVGTSDCGVEDAVAEHENAFLVEYTDVSGFAHAILQILKDPALRKKMGEKSLSFVQKFDWKNKIDEYERLYRGR
ncbi:MAG TPA: glycosyltransferase, partial [Candidatus Paceibacterota bacterium]